MSDALRTSRLPTTVDEFLVWPGDGRAKYYELVDGEVRAMAPASFTHGLIQATLTILVGRKLIESGSRCRVVVAGGVVPRVRSNDNFRVPDLLVTCSAIEAGQGTAPDPVLIVEILSPSNAADTWTNVWAYTTVPSVREILVIHSTKVKAHLLRRLPDGAWPDNPAELDENATLALESVDFSCALRDVYEGTHLA